MDELGLFTAALGLGGPWRVARTEFDAQQTRLDLYLEFDRGARFPCPVGGCAHDACRVHDTADKTWRHLDGSSLYQVGYSASGHVDGRGVGDGG